MLPEKYLPNYHFNEKHNIVISSSPAKIYSIICELDASSSWIVSVLLALRGISKETSTGIEGWKKMGFVVLEQQQDKEIILGLIGQFWKVSGKIQKCTAAEFISFNNLNFAKTVWNFKITPQEGTRILLETETRIFCLDKTIRKKFGRYWFFIKPFSGLIRTEMLKAIKRRAEK